MMKPKYRYTYRLTRQSDQAFYIGSRSAASCPPEEDFGTHYFTSGDLQEEFRANPEQFTWTILSEDYANNVSMLEDEARLILKSWDEPGRMNRTAHPLVFEMDAVWREKHAEANRRKAQDPKWRKKNAEAGRRNAQDPEWRRKNAEAMRRLAQDPEWRKNAAKAGRRRAQDPVWRKNTAEGTRRRSQNPVWRESLTAALRKNWQDPEYRKMMSKAFTKREARKRAARQANENTLCV